MVTLSKIYTKTGDGGTTRLGDNSSVAKTDPRIEAYGTIDELNAILGLCLAHGLEAEQVDLIQAIQNDLFDMGADLCCPLVDGEEDRLRIHPDQSQRLEGAIDQINAPLSPLKSFVLPGGSRAAAWFHLARTVCRRAERQVWSLAGEQPVNPAVAIYLNRLSDLLFVLSRAANAGGKNDILWQPGKNQKDTNG